MSKNNGNYKNVLDYIKNVATVAITSLLLRSDLFLKSYLNNIKTIDTDVKSYSNVKLNDISIKPNSTELYITLNNTPHKHSIDTITDPTIIIRDTVGNIQSKVNSNYYTGFKLSDGTDLIDVFYTKKNNSIMVRNENVNSSDGMNHITKLELNMVDGILVLRRTYGYINHIVNKTMEM